MIYPHLEQEIIYWGGGAKHVVGIDEAGRGPLAGPVVAGAVIVFPEIIENIQGESEYKLIRDSKTLSAGQRGKAYEFITKNFQWGMGVTSEGTIDRVNILQASFLAMKKALADLRARCRVIPDMILVDGKMPIPNLSLAQKQIVNGDRFVFSIAAASIVAKVTRDRLMLEYDQKFPAYGFAKHKGYGTKFHYGALEKHGPCPIHRKSFRLQRKKPLTNISKKLQSS